MTTIPFGWDDSSNIKAMKNVTINSYNAVSIEKQVSDVCTHKKNVLIPYNIIDWVKTTIHSLNFAVVCVVGWKCNFIIIIEAAYGAPDHNKWEVPGVEVSLWEMHAHAEYILIFVYQWSPFIC